MKRYNLPLSFIAGLLLGAATMIPLGAQAQRPTGDTINHLSEPTYMQPWDVTPICPPTNQLCDRWGWWNNYYFYLWRGRVMSGGLTLNDTSLRMLIERGAEDFTVGITYHPIEPVKVIGVAAFSRLYEEYHGYVYEPEYGRWAGGNRPLDTTISGMETDYLQLYSISNKEATPPQLIAQGPWRWDGPNRHSTIFSTISWDDKVIEVLFDDTIRMDTAFMVAGTNNNKRIENVTYNGRPSQTPGYLVQGHYAADYLFLEFLQQHLPSRPSHPIEWWIQYMNEPWYSDTINRGSDLLPYLCIFPIIDTSYRPCVQAVESLRAESIDSTEVTVAWNSSGGGTTDWEVAYAHPGDTVVTFPTTVPTATLTGLTPGTTYDIFVRTICSTNEPGPWCSPLTVTLPRDTTAGVPPDTSTIDTTTTIDTTVTIDTLPVVEPLGTGAEGSNLDIFTHVVPNPASGWVQVVSCYGLRHIALFSLDGHKVLDKPAEGYRTGFDTSSLPEAAYILAIYSPQGVVTRKIAVIH